MTDIDWEKLTFDTLKDETLSVVKDEDWQVLRKSLKGQPLELKYAALSHWIKVSPNAVALNHRKLQVGNYVNALRRAGLVPRRNYE